MRSASPAGWMDALERMVEPARPVARFAARLAVAAAASGAAIWWAVARSYDGSAVVEWVVAVVLLLPPLALLLVTVAARAVLGLPKKLGEAPAALREHAQRIRDRAGELATGRDRGAVASLRSVGRLWWAVASSREILEILGPAALVVSPATVVVGIAGTIGAVLEILVGVASVLWLALT